jgi:hypothetical protein
MTVRANCPDRFGRRSALVTRGAQVILKQRSVSMFRCVHTVGTVPPSMTYSLPVIDEAR